MAELATVARPYAEALFRVAQTGDMNAWSTLVSELAQIGANADVQEYARNPNVSEAQVADAFASLVKAPLTAEANRILSQAKADAEQQVTKAREELRSQVAALAVKGAEQILKREVNAAAHADLLSQLSVEL